MGASKWTIETANAYVNCATYKGLRYWSAMDYLKLRKAGPYAPAAIDPDKVAAPAKKKVTSKKHSAKRGNT